jgi:hypothetical protein
MLTGYKYYCHELIWQTFLSMSHSGNNGLIWQMLFVNNLLTANTQEELLVHFISKQFQVSNWTLTLA